MNLIILFFCFSAFASESSLKLGGFLDTYYAYDFNTPKNGKRLFTATAPVRHNDPNINLAYIDATLTQQTTRARLAIQQGHSVIRNAFYETSFTRAIQEAYIGKKFGEKTWIDGGIFLGNIGSESWISKDNWTYTRALFLDYVPYYSAGARLEHQLDEKQSFQLQLLNGWQNVAENNQAKAVGMQYKKLVDEKFTFTYNNFFGDEEVVSTLPRFRAYHNFIFHYLHSDLWQFLYAFDVGHQAQQQNNGVDIWMATALTIRRVLNPRQALALRTEYYNDRHQTNVVSGTPNGFQVVGASLNLDQKLAEKAMWRTEIRGFNSKDKIYPKGSDNRNRLDGFLITSLSLWL